MRDWIYFTSLYILFLLPHSVLAVSPNTNDLWLAEQAQLVRDLTSDYFRTVSVKHFRRENNIYVWLSEQNYQQDQKIGLRYRPNSKVRNIVRTEEAILSDVVFNFDQFGRRKTPGQTEGRKKFIILSGCSYTFGAGLNDDETLSFYLSKELPEYETSNYGIAGTGTNTTLAIIDSGLLKSEITQAHGVFVYVLVDLHIDRAVGKLPSLRWLKQTPYYEIDDDGAAIRKGNFEDGRPIYTRLLLKFGEIMQLFPSLSSRIIPPLTRQDYLDTCAMVKAAREKFLAQYPDSKFLVYGHPLSADDPSLIACLKKSGVETYLGKRFRPLLPVKIPIDNHPTAFANSLIAKDLAEEIQKLGKEE